MTTEGEQAAVVAVVEGFEGPLVAPTHLVDKPLIRDPSKDGARERKAAGKFKRGGVHEKGRRPSA